MFFTKRKKKTKNKKGPGKGETWVGILSAMIFIGALVWMPLVTFFVKRYGKKHLLMVAGYLFYILYLFIIFFIYFIYIYIVYLYIKNIK